ncbi:NAD-dependent epimerase/dehydratase terH [Fusarium oxysporum f. sp. albedinis]|nr:NAD-dependent epimerase/dehydratase terH [Fusarium oxysporum f. sp. albedinis]
MLPKPKQRQSTSELVIPTLLALCRTLDDLPRISQSTHWAHHPNFELAVTYMISGCNRQASATKNPAIYIFST